MSLTGGLAAASQTYCLADEGSGTYDVTYTATDHEGNTSNGKTITPRFRQKI